jgi:hypothetical protein
MSILIKAIPVENNYYVVEVLNTCTNRNIAIEVYDSERRSEEDIAKQAFKELIMDSLLGLHRYGKLDAKDHYQSTLESLREVMSVEELIGGVHDGDPKMFNA